jgi:hypothetical protein
MSLLPGALRAKHQKPLAELSWEPPGSIESLFNEHRFEATRIHDPCCGSGPIPIVVRKFGYEASDIVDRGFGTVGVDFFKGRFALPGGGLQPARRRETRSVAGHPVCHACPGSCG